MPENIDEPKSLHELVSKTSNDNKNRRVVGYSVASYVGVLSALEKAKVISGDDAVRMISKHDLSAVAGMVYDGSGFSNDLTSGIWKMSMTFHGSAPIKQTSEAWYEVVKFQNDDEKRAEKMDAFKRSCPYWLSQEGLNWVTQEDFLAGAYIDLQKLGVNYFNHFYANGETVYTENIVSKLVSSGYLVAQIVFPQKNTYKVVKILGQHPIGKAPIISLTSSLVACNGWEDLGLSIRVTQNDTKPVIFMPNGTEYVHPCQGEMYDFHNGKINNFTRSNFQNKWLPYSMTKVATQGVNLQMELPVMQECYVRLFVPSVFRNEALKIIGNPPNEYIFQEYPGKLVYVPASDGEFVGDAASLIGATVKKWASVDQTTVIGTNTNKIRYSTDLGVRPSQFKRGSGPLFLSTATQHLFKPIFGHPNNLNVLDCSSFVSLMLWDSGIVRDDVTTVRAFGSSELCSPLIVGQINKYLKENYEVKYIDLVDASQVQAGDVLCITKEERLRFHNEHKNYGHVVIACPEGDKQYTVEIGSTKDAIGTKILRSRPYTYYKHIIRIVEKQTQTN